MPSAAGSTCRTARSRALARRERFDDEVPRDLCAGAITEEFGENSLEVQALDLGIADADGRYWAAITNGPQPFYVNDDGDPINFFHIVVAYRFNNDGTWSDEIDWIEIETAPQRTDSVEIITLDAAPGSAWIAIRGPTGAHAATLDVIRFDG